MRALLQRVRSADATVEGEQIAAIGRGLLALVGIHRDDQPEDGERLARKIIDIRIFEDEQGKMGRSVKDIAGEILVVSQFTLYGAMDKGTRPDFTASMPGAQAKIFYEQWLAKLRELSPVRIAEGRFAATMDVRLVNEGPVTIMLDSRKG